MKKLIMLIMVLVSIFLIDNLVQASPASKWKCSLCGQEKRQVITQQPSTTGCKVAKNHKHIWFQIK